MGWWSDLFGAPAPVVAAPEQRIGGDPALSDGERLERQIARFSRALEQCEKPAKARELRAWLDYYSNLKSAQRRLDGALGS
jgi:hypothetical protein